MELNREALIALRERSGMSKTELADRAGIDRTLVTRIENGERRATPKVMRKLAEGLQVSVVALMGPAEMPACDGSSECPAAEHVLGCYCSTIADVRAEVGV